MKVRLPSKYAEKEEVFKREEEITFDCWDYAG